MINVDKKSVEQTIEKYGADKQLVVAVEELSELQKEICKHLRGKANRTHIVEEMADVLIMISNVKVIFDIQDDEIKKLIEQKQARTQMRMLCDEK